MNPAGHLVVAHLMARRLDRGRALARFGPFALGALWPDLVDKSVMVLGLSPYGRTVGHSILLWLGAALVVQLALGMHGWRSRVGAFTLGGVSHLVTDLVDDVVGGFERGGFIFSAWAGWPLTNPDMASVPVPSLLEPMRYATSVLELALLVAWGLLVLFVDREHTRV